MNVSITPHKKGDGGILALPLQSNIPKGRKDWHRQILKKILMKVFFKQKPKKMI